MKAAALGPYGLLRRLSPKASADSGYESNNGADSEGGDNALADDGDSGEDDRWQTQGSVGGSSFGGFWSGGGGYSDEGRFAPLWVEGERHEEKIVRGAGLLVLTFGSVKATQDAHAGNRQQSRGEWQNKRRHKGRLRRGSASSSTGTVAAQGEVVHEPGAREENEVAKARDRARAGWDTCRVRSAALELGMVSKHFN